MLDNVLGDYTFKVEGPGLSLTLDATDMGMALDSQSIADGLLAEMNPWAWPYEVFQRHDDTDDLVSTLENSKLADTLTAAVEEANACGTAPKNATVAYDADEGGYVVVPEEEGNTLLSDVVIDEVTRGTVNFAPKVTLSDAGAGQAHGDARRPRAGRGARCGQQVPRRGACPHHGGRREDGPSPPTRSPSTSPWATTSP